VDADGIRQVAALYGSPVQVRRKDLHINCPWGQYHSKGFDSSQGLSVKIAPHARSVCYCFSCGARGALSFVFEEAAKIDSSYVEVSLFILQRDGASLSGALASLRRDAGMQEVPSTDWNAYSARCSRQVPDYLVGRGIVNADVTRWRLGFDSNLQRAILPVWDETKNVVGCLRRAVHPDQQPKYKDTPGAIVWKKTVFYGEHLIDRTRGVAHVVEGPMGTIFAARLLPNVIGMMGADTGIEDERLAKLKRWGIKTLILMLDSDKKGAEAVYGRRYPDGEWKPGLRDLMRPHFVVKVAKLPPGEDPDDVVRRDPTALRRIVSAAAYLESPAHLTGGTGSDSIPTSPKDRKSIIDYMKERRSPRQ